MPTPAQVSARPYTAAHSTSSGIRAAAGAVAVRITPRMTGTTAMATAIRLSSVTPTDRPMYPSTGRGMGVPDRFSTG